MAGNVKAIPEGMHTLTPHLVIRGAAKAIEFYKKAFGAQERSVHKIPDGMVMHAELKIGDSTVMLADEFPGAPCQAPQTAGTTTTVLHLYVDDVDSWFNRAASAGATVVMPVMDMFWGDRYGQLKDPFGHLWAIATHKEDVESGEVERRGAAMMAEMTKKMRAGTKAS
ncbi:MAG: VOC family protein [Terriglobia bacterium]